MEMRTQEFEAGDVKVSVTLPVDAGRIDLDLWLFSPAGTAIIDAVGLENFDPIKDTDQQLECTREDGRDRLQLWVEMPGASASPARSEIAAELARRQRDARLHAGGLVG